MCACVRMCVCACMWVFEAKSSLIIQSGKSQRKVLCVCMSNLRKTTMAPLMSKFGRTLGIFMHCFKALEDRMTPCKGVARD